MSKSRRWPHRLLLLLLLAGLIGGGVQLSTSANAALVARQQREAAAAAVKNQPPVVQPVAPVGPYVAGAVSINPTSLTPPSSGCAIDMTADAPVRPPGNCRVLVIGDSLAINLGIGLVRELAGTPGLQIVQRGRYSTGLSNSWFYDWNLNLKSLLRKYQPHLVVVMFGANDHQAMQIDGAVSKFGTPDWTAAYSAKVKQIVQSATDAGAYVAWVKLPVMEPPKYRRGMSSLNSYYDQAVPALPGTALISTWDYFADAAGRYRESAEVNGRSTQIRGDDGIHFSTIGQSVLATFAIRQLRTAFHIDLKPLRPRTITG